jgi:sugar phosphate isomerase/epimerase
MRASFSLAHLTVLSMPPPAVIATAAGAGYDFAGLRLLPATPGGVAYPLMDEPALLHETLARMRDTGVGVLDVEIVRLDERFEVARLLPFLEAGAKLGARAVLVGGDDRDEARLAHSFAALCEAAGTFGLTADIEFMPWTAVPDARSAVKLMNAAGLPSHAGVLIDAIHFARSDTRLDEIEALPPSWLHYAQMCDAPAAMPPTVEELIRAARHERLLPGEGGIDLQGLFARLPRELPIALEIPNDARASAMGQAEWARLAIECARNLIEASR